ncbi:MAG: hypothetical protein PHD95_04420, partial [Candidatus ainarchaeum sp.]|nr:hypothetical protein [Candidatus ainarchaeum sp.]
EMQKGFDEIFRVLKAHAKAVISVPNSQSILWKLVHFFQKAKLYSCPKIEYSREQHTEQHWKKTLGMLEKTGFEIFGMHSILVFPLPLISNIIPKKINSAVFARLWHFLANGELRIGKGAMKRFGSSVVFQLKK